MVTDGVSLNLKTLPLRALRLCGDFLTAMAKRTQKVLYDNGGCHLEFKNPFSALSATLWRIPSSLCVLAQI
jgi:hypothetical protein